MLRPLLEALLVALDSDEENALGLARQWHLQGRLRAADTVSTELLDSARKLIDNRGGPSDELRDEVRDWLEALG